MSVDVAAGAVPSSCVSISGRPPPSLHMARVASSIRHQPRRFHDARSHVAPLPRWVTPEGAQTKKLVACNPPTERAVPDVDILRPTQGVVTAGAYRYGAEAALTASTLQRRAKPVRPDVMMLNMGDVMRTVSVASLRLLLLAFKSLLLCLDLREGVLLLLLNGLEQGVRAHTKDRRGRTQDGLCVGWGVEQQHRGEQDGARLNLPEEHERERGGGACRGTRPGATRVK